MYFQGGTLLSSGWLLLYRSSRGEQIDHGGGREAPEETLVVENKKVVFVDDVLYTGRSIRAALTAIQSFGRPNEIELLTLIDRRFSRHLPIRPNYKGLQVDAINEEKVKVHWEENEGKDQVILVPK